MLHKRKDTDAQKVELCKAVFTLTLLRDSTLHSSIPKQKLIVDVKVATKTAAGSKLLISVPNRARMLFAT